MVCLSMNTRQCKMHCWISSILTYRTNGCPKENRPPELAKTAQLPLNRMQYNLNYLASQKVRILEQLPAQSESESKGRYRLAHERLIPALESLAGELLAAAEQAKRLLNDRFRTWVKVKRRKFLLSGKELRDVLKYRSHFKVDIRPELLQYIRGSNKKRHLNISFGILFVLSLLFWQPFNKKVIEPWQRDQRIQIFKKQFVAVEGGVFEMGARSEDGESDEKSVHMVKLDGFQISRYEITNQQYCDFLNSHDSLMVKADEWLDFGSSRQIRKRDGRFVIPDEAFKDTPVVAVNWFGAAVFCNFMSERNDYKPSYNVTDWSCDISAKGFRLPTEAEWEYAARGGLNSGGYKYSGSDSLDAVAWYYSNAENEVRSVGGKQPNELGIYDMSGNVWEWCMDWYDNQYYDECKEKGVVDNPQGPETGSRRVLRGGSWDFSGQFCRSANRFSDDPDDRDYDIGFRLVFVP